jgi:hypothetical protein
MALDSSGHSGDPRLSRRVCLPRLPFRVLLPVSEPARGPTNAELVIATVTVRMSARLHFKRGPPPGGGAKPVRAHPCARGREAHSDLTTKTAAQPPYRGAGEEHCRSVSIAAPACGRTRRACAGRPVNSAPEEGQHSGAALRGGPETSAPGDPDPIALREGSMPKGRDPA